MTGFALAATLSACTTPYRVRAVTAEAGACVRECRRDSVGQLLIDCTESCPGVLREAGTCDEVPPGTADRYCIDRREADGNGWPILGAIIGVVVVVVGIAWISASQLDFGSK